MTLRGLRSFHSLRPLPLYGSDWTVSVSGIEGMYADPDHGKTNFYFCIVVPKNTGAARTGKVIVSGGNTKHEITVNQKGE